MRYHLVVSIALILSVGTPALCETIPAWDSITVTTSDPGMSVTITARGNNARLSALEVTIGTNRMQAPKTALKDTAYPQLWTLHMGYWTPDLKTFYVALDCGQLNSSLPQGKQPETLLFYFSNGTFSRVERTPAMRKGDMITEQEASPRTRSPERRGEP